MAADLRFLPQALLLWRQNRLQALLSTLGIVAGVIGLMLVIALGTGARRELDAALGSLGAGTLIIKRKPDSLALAVLNSNHLAAIERLVGDQLTLLSPSRISHQRVKSATEQLPKVKIVATQRQHQQLNGARLYRGRYLADFDLVNREPVCVLGWQLGKTLFPRGQVIGEQIRLSSGWCRVVGWLEPSALGSSALKPLGLTEIDNGVFMPLSLYGGHQPVYPLDEIAIKVKVVDNLGTVMAVVETIVGRTSDSDELDFLIPLQVLQQQQQLQRLFQYVMLVVSGLMLVVGGIGIMNVMMVNVLSRRAEIGLRRAIGATPQDILRQFFTEALVVSMVGGLIGIAAGLALAAAIDSFTTWPMAISLQGLISGFLVSVVIGLIFGSYPALQAASVSPIKALNQL